MKRLNLGCGDDIKEGWVNLDSSAIDGVEVVHDMEQLPLPFPDQVFEEVLCQDILEHLEYIPVLRDIHRIMKKGASLTIRVPHFTSKNSYTDPTHKKFFAIRTFSFFTKDSIKGRKYYFNFHFEKIGSQIITFEKSSRLFFFNRLVSSVVNMSPRMQYLFESTFLSRLFPAENIIVKLIK